MFGWLWGGYISVVRALAAAVRLDDWGEFPGTQTFNGIARILQACTCMSLIVARLCYSTADGITPSTSESLLEEKSIQAAAENGTHERTLTLTWLWCIPNWTNFRLARWQWSLGEDRFVSLRSKQVLIRPYPCSDDIYVWTFTHACTLHICIAT